MKFICQGYIGKITKKTLAQLKIIENTDRIIYIGFPLMLNKDYYFQYLRNNDS